MIMPERMLQSGLTEQFDEVNANALILTPQYLEKGKPCECIPALWNQSVFDGSFFGAN